MRWTVWHGREMPTRAHQRHLCYFSVFLCCTLLALVACRAETPAGGLATELPDLFPAVEDVPRFLPQTQAELMEMGVKYNNGGYDALHVSREFDEEARAAGRVDEYVARFQLEPPPAGRVFISASVGLYEDDRSAQDVLDALSRSPSGGVVPAASIGDASVAWTSATSGGEPVCPCLLYFREGPLVGAVSVGRASHKARAFDGPEEIQVTWAQEMLYRMRQALAEPPTRY